MIDNSVIFRRDFSSPKVSVCIPSRNTRAFLEERRSSIEHQSFTDYEVIVVDDGSTDGSWEFFENWAAENPRIAAYQGPGKGLYAGWNDTISRSRGEYIYIATSDDTMAPNFLEETVASLEVQKNCGIAIAPLKILPGYDGLDSWWNEWWKESSAFARSTEAPLDRPHLRMCPGDGLLHAAGESVYVSVTQLLVRKSVFEEIGYYPIDRGVIGDFAWAIAAGLNINSVFVPNTWGGWRIHDGQATAQGGLSQQERRTLNRRTFHEVASRFLSDQNIKREVTRVRKVMERVDRMESLAGIWRDSDRIRLINLLKALNSDPAGLLAEFTRKFRRSHRSSHPHLDSVISLLKKDLRWIVALE